MIRINLLDGMPRGRAVQAKLHRGGASAFLSGREAFLGGLFLLLGAVILAGVFAFAPQDDGAVDLPPNVEAEPAGDAKADAGQAPESAANAEPKDNLATGDDLETRDDPEAAGDPGATAAAETEEPLLITAEIIRPPAADPEPPKPSPTTTPGPGWEDAARVTELEVRPLGRQLEVFLGVQDGEVDISTFNLDNPGRIVVDVKNARLETRTRILNVGHPLLQKIRIAQNLFDPPRVRLVMDVGEIPDMVIVDRSGGFVFLVTPDE